MNKVARDVTNHPVGREEGCAGGAVCFVRCDEKVNNVAVGMLHGPQAMDRWREVLANAGAVGIMQEPVVAQRLCHSWHDQEFNCHPVRR